MKRWRRRGWGGVQFLKKAARTIRVEPIGEVLEVDGLVPLGIQLQLRGSRRPLAGAAGACFSPTGTVDSLVAQHHQLRHEAQPLLARCVRGHLRQWHVPEMKTCRMG